MGCQDVLKRKSGVIYGDDVHRLFKYAQEKSFAIPAINVTSSSTVVSSLEAARDKKSPIILQLSQGGAAYFCGKVCCLDLSPRLPLRPPRLTFSNNRASPTRINRLQSPELWLVLTLSEPWLLLMASPSSSTQTIAPRSCCHGSMACSMPTRLTLRRIRSLSTAVT